jgi:hypothetical protein
MVKFLFLLGIDLLFHLFVLFFEGLDSLCVFLVDFIMKLDNILIEVFFDSLLGLFFERGKLLEINLNRFESGFLFQEVHEVLLLLLEIGDLAFEFDELLLVGGKVVFHLFDEVEFRLQFVLDFSLQ